MLAQYKVWAVTYDEYQLHDFMTQFQKDFKGPQYSSFSQADRRLQADTALLTRLRQGRFLHSGNEALREHIQNADAKESADGRAIRIVKRHQDYKIDAVIALSMAAYKATRDEKSQSKERGTVTAVRFEGVFGTQR